jgi:hypothetical protein
MSHTHVGFMRLHNGNRRSTGSAMHKGRCHALNGGAGIYEGARYEAICGETVVADLGYREYFNVQKVGGSGSIFENPQPMQITCKRCQRLIKLGTSAEAKS